MIETITFSGDNESTRLVRDIETNIGNFFADAMQWYAQTQTSSKDDLDAKIIAIQNGGGIRASIEITDNNKIVTKGQINDVSPFNNTFLTLKVTGKQLKDIFNISASKWQDGGFLQVSSNIEVNYDLNVATDLEKNEVKSIKFKNEEIKDEDIFIVATNDFLRAGGDGYDVLKNLEEIASADVLTEVLIAYGKELPNLVSLGYKAEDYKNGFIKPKDATRIIINPINEKAKTLINNLNLKQL